MMDKFDSISDLFDHAERQTQSTTLVGTVKPCEDDEHHFMFSPTNCDDWLKIPRNGVEGVEYWGQVGCRKKDEEPHRHPLVRLRLTKQCVAELPHLITLSRVIRQKQSALHRLAAANRFMRMRGSATAPVIHDASGYYPRQGSLLLDRQAMLSPCFLVNDGGSMVVCCCDENGNNCECGGIV